MTALVRTRPAPSRAAGRTSSVPARRSSPEESRPRLRVVDDSRLQLAARQHRARLTVLAASVAVVGCLFAVAAFHAFLVSGQVRLDRLEEQVVDAQARYSASRLEVAELEAPGRIVQVAQERLGLVAPPGVTYLTPSGAVVDEVGGVPDDADAQLADGDGENEDGAGTSWGAVKPYLGSHQ